MDILKAYEILEVSINATPHEIRIAYLDLMAIWHPDKYEHNPRLRHKATEKTKQITEAYNLIKTSINVDQDDVSRESTSTIKEDKSRVVRCSNCGAFNRVNSVNLSSFSCGRCKGPLSFTQDFRETEGKRRQACGDGSCIGYIGKNGRCIICGKTYSDGVELDNKKNEEQYRRYKEKHEEQKRRHRRKNIIKTASAVFAIFIIFLLFMFSGSKKKKPFYGARGKELDSVVEKILKDNGFQVNPNSTNELFTSDQKNLKNIKKLGTLIKLLGQNKDTVVGEITANIERSSITEIKTIQKCLTILGYEVGSADGKIGPKSKQAIEEYVDEFNIASENTQVLLYQRFLDTLKKNTEIARQCKDWRLLNRTGKLRAWIGSQPPATSYMYQEVLETGSARAIRRLVTIYEFAQEKPKGHLFPPNGILYKKFDKGIAPLIIKTKGLDGYYVKLLDSTTGNEILTAFVAGGTQLKMNVPLGSYQLKYASGRTWYGTKYLFGPATTFSKADKIFAFKREGYKVHGYSIELYRQIHGNLPTKEISPFDF